MGGAQSKTQEYYYECGLLVYLQNIFFKRTPHSIWAQILFCINQLCGNIICYRANKFLLYIEKNLIYAITSKFC